MTKIGDCYAVLGIPGNASPDEIRQAYRKLARARHPDVDKSPKATENFQAINEAYQTLSNPSRKRDHDRALNQQDHQWSPRTVRAPREPKGAPKPTETTTPTTPKPTSQKVQEAAHREAVRIARQREETAKRRKARGAKKRKPTRQSKLF